MFCDSDITEVHDEPYNHPNLIKPQQQLYRKSSSVIYLGLIQLELKLNHGDIICCSLAARVYIMAAVGDYTRLPGSTTSCLDWTETVPSGPTQAEMMTVKLCLIVATNHDLRHLPQYLHNPSPS